MICDVAWTVSFAPCDVTCVVICALRDVTCDEARNAERFAELYGSDPDGPCPSKPSSHRFSPRSDAAPAPCACLHPTSSMLSPPPSPPPPRNAAASAWLSTPSGQPPTDGTAYPYNLALDPLFFSQKTLKEACVAVYVPRIYWRFSRRKLLVMEVCIHKVPLCSHLRHSNASVRASDALAYAPSAATDVHMPVLFEDADRVVGQLVY
eukprot:1305576-Rhodomonas_salina.3